MNRSDSQNRLVNCVYGTNTSSYVYRVDGFQHQSTVTVATIADSPGMDAEAGGEVEEGHAQGIYLDWQQVIGSKWTSLEDAVEPGMESFPGWIP